MVVEQFEVLLLWVGEMVETVRSVQSGGRIWNILGETYQVRSHSGPNFKDSVIAHLLG